MAIDKKTIMNQNLYIILLLLVVLIVLPKMHKQAIVPDCFMDLDCAVPIKSGYMRVEYWCNIGHCYSEQIPFPEKCNDKIDNDFDDLIDCADKDCFGDRNCHCATMSYNICLKGECYCPVGKIPKWVVVNGEGNCECR